jgi:transcriptional regulator with XRE-family HTH domain
MAQSYESPAAFLLQLARLKSGRSQREVAERAGVPTTMISVYERGQREPTLATLLKLLHAADLELTMQLEPYDRHDEVLDTLEAKRSRSERRRRDREIEAWRRARPVEVAS